MPTVAALRESARKAATEAKAFIESGDIESANKASEEGEKLLKQIAEQETAVNRVKALTGQFNNDEALNRLPVSTEEAKQWKQEEGKAKYTTDYEPPTWVKGMPAAVQPIWVREKMGDNQKSAADFQTRTWLKWFRSSSEQAFRMNASSDELKAMKAMQENTDSEGGYFVPEEYRTIVIHDTGAPFGVHRPRCTQFTTGLKDGYMPTMGSVTWAAIAEEAAYGDNTPTVGQVSYTIRKSGGTTKVSMELLEDSQANVPALLSQIFGEASGRYEDQQIIEGDGTTEPEGLRTTATDGTDSAANNAVAIGDILNWYYSLPAQFRSNASWSTTSSFMAKVAALEVTSNKGSLTAAPDTTLLGKPVGMFDGTGWDDAAAIAADEELGAIGDFRNYYLIDRIGMTLRRDDSIYVANDQVGFFARRRFDGRVGLANAFRIMKIVT